MKKQYVKRTLALVIALVLTFTGMDYNAIAAINDTNDEIIAESVYEVDSIEQDSESGDSDVALGDKSIEADSLTENDELKKDDESEIDASEETIVIDDDDSDLDELGGDGVGCTGSDIFNVCDKAIVKTEKKDSGMKNKNNKVIYNYELKSFKHANDDGSSHLFGMDTFSFKDDNTGEEKVAAASNSKYRDFTLSQEIYKIDSGACSGIPSKQSYTNKTNEERNKKIMAWKMKYLLRSITVSEYSENDGLGLQTIDASAFEGSALQIADLKYADRLTYIGENAFANCSGLKYVILPDNVSTLFYNSFPTNTILVCKKNTVTYNKIMEVDSGKTPHAIKVPIGTNEVTSVTIAQYNKDQVGVLQGVANVEDCKLKVTVSAGANGTVTGAGTYLVHSNVTLQASPKTGYQISEVTINKSKIASPSEQIVINNLTKDTEVSVSFSQRIYKIYVHTGSETKTVSVAYNSAPSGIPALVARKGYNVSWNTAENGKGEAFDPSKAYTRTSDLNIYQTYVSDGKAYSVILDPNGGTIDETSINVVAGRNYPDITVTPVKEGFVFLGWFYGNSKITKDVIVGDVPDKLVAKWEEEKDERPVVTVSYIGKYGSASINDVSENDILEETTNVNDVDGSTVILRTIKAKVEPGNKVSLTVKAENDRCAVLYMDGNVVSSTTKNEDTFTITDKIENDINIELHFTSKTDNGWVMTSPITKTTYDVKDGFVSGLVVTFADETRMCFYYNENKIVYIDKDENVISTIKLDLSDCCSLAQIIKISDDGVPSLYCPYKSGYKFKNWADGNNNDVEIVDLRTFKDNVELKPVFEKVDERNNDNENNKDDENSGTDDNTPNDEKSHDKGSCTVEYLLNGGSVSTKDQGKLITNYGENTIKLPKAKKKGYVFVGWFINDVKVSSIGKNNAVCTGNIKAEARFVMKQKKANATGATGSCKIEYEYNGGTPTKATNLPDSYANNAKIKLPKLKKAGYKFLGWFVNDGDTVYKITKISSNTNAFANMRDAKVYALWTPDEYVFTFNKAKNGQGKMDKFTSYYDVKTILPENKFTNKKSNAQFCGWTFNNTVVNAGEEFLPQNKFKERKVKLRAVWKYVNM